MSTTCAKRSAALALLFLLASAALAGPLFIDPAASTAWPGQIIGLDVRIDAITDLYAFQFDISYDPAVLSAISVAEGPFLPSGGMTIPFLGMIDPVAGRISFIADTLVGAIPGVSGSGTLVMLEFVAAGVGMAAVGIENVVLLNSALADITVGIEGATVTVIPEPSSFLLLGSAILAVLIFRRRVPA